MGHAIPMWLGNHLMWVMKRMGVEVLPYSHMQYCRVVQEQQTNGTDKDLFEVFVRKSYDRLDVRKHTTNMMLVFPSQTERSHDLISDTNGLESAPDGGYLVNSELCARSKVYVAGPSANIPHPLFGRMGLEGEEDAWVSGVHAGRNMAGARAQYAHVAHRLTCRMVGTESVNLQVIGQTHDNLDTVGYLAMGRWAQLENDVPQDASTRVVSKPSGEPPVARRRSSGSGEDDSEFLQVAPRSGVVYFLQMPEQLRKGHQIDRQTGRVVGVALLNMPPSALIIARSLITERRQVADDEELRKVIAVDKCDSGRKSIKRTTQGKTAVNSRTSAQAPGIGTSNDKWTRAIFGTLPHER